MRRCPGSWASAAPPESLRERPGCLCSSQRFGYARREEEKTRGSPPHPYPHQSSPALRRDSEEAAKEHCGENTARRVRPHSAQLCVASHQSRPGFLAALARQALCLALGLLLFGEMKRPHLYPCLHSQPRFPSRFLPSLMLLGRAEAVCKGLWSSSPLFHSLPLAPPSLD